MRFIEWTEVAQGGVFENFEGLNTMTSLFLTAEKYLPSNSSFPFQAVKKRIGGIGPFWRGGKL